LCNLTLVGYNQGMRSLRRHDPLPPSLTRAVDLWADATTDADSPRRADLLRDKVQALLGSGDNGSAAGFFVCVPRPIDQVRPADVAEWRAYLEQMGLAGASIYARLSRLSSFYKWLQQDPAFRAVIRRNPVDLARPKAPPPYQSPRAQALSDEDARALLAHVQSEAAGDSLSAVRDYALLRFYFATGKRRSEIIGLRWRDLRFTDDALIIQTQEKGGLYRATEIRDAGVKSALLRYLKATERWDFQRDKPLIDPDDPLWLRHDNAARGQQAVTSHGFVKMFKQYARAAGLGDVHLHQTRHTVARLVGEDSGDLHSVQTVLGHRHQATTRVYLERIAIKRDNHSQNIARRLIDDDAVAGGDEE